MEIFTWGVGVIGGLSFGFALGIYMELRMKNRLEEAVEKDHVARVEADGGVSYKFVSPGRAGPPDRLDLYGVERMIPTLAYHLPHRSVSQLHKLARDLLAAAIQFTELKKKDEDPEPHQLREHKRLRARGFTVNVVDE
jgi:hypothetical protein